MNPQLSDTRCSPEYDSQTPPEPRGYQSLTLQCESAPAGSFSPPFAARAKGSKSSPTRRPGPSEVGPTANPWSLGKRGPEERGGLGADATPRLRLLGLQSAPCAPRTRPLPRAAWRRPPGRAQRGAGSAHTRRVRVAGGPGRRCIRPPWQHGGLRKDSEFIPLRRPSGLDHSQLVRKGRVR